MSADDIQHPFPSELVLDNSETQEEYKIFTRMLNLIQEAVQEDGLENLIDKSWEEEYLFSEANNTAFLTIPRDTWNRILTDIYNANRDTLVHPDDWHLVKEIHQEYMEDNSEYRSNRWTTPDEEAIPATYEAFVVNL